MSAAWIYLDNNATTAPLPEVLDAVHEMEASYWANASSVHRFGQAVRQRVELARSSLAGLLGCRDRELVFTSGGTESNNLVLRGLLAPPLAPAPPTGEPGSPPHAPAPSAPPTAPDAPRRRVLLTTRLEHSAIREPAQMLARWGVEVVFLPVDAAGRVSPADLAQALRDRVGPDAVALVSIQWANNETGVIEPIPELAAEIRAHRQAQPRARVLFHTDATQAAGKLPIDVKAAGVDLLTLSAHKFHGPKGAGALFVRTGVRLEPQNLGGPQERDRRGGTENAPAIVGMGVAARLACEFLADPAATQRLAALRDQFEQRLLQALRPLLPDAVAHAADAPRLWNTSNIAFPRLEAEAILLGLSEKGLCASAGAACSSGSLEPSPVLLAMGVPPPLAHGSVRFSLSRLTTPDEIDRALEIAPAVIARLARTLPSADAHAPASPSASA